MSLAPAGDSATTLTYTATARVGGKIAQLGSRLFDATFEALAPKGFEKLFTFVRGDNAPALTAYLRQGFRVVGAARGHARIDGVAIDEIIIEKMLERAR